MTPRYSRIKLCTLCDKENFRNKVPDDTTKLVKSSYLWRVGLEGMEGGEGADILHYKYFNIISLV